MGIYRSVYHLTCVRLWLGGSRTVVRSGYITLIPGRYHSSPLLVFTAVRLSCLQPYHSCSSFSPPVFATSFIADSMSPRKPTKAGSSGEDPGSLSDGWSCYLGKLRSARCPVRAKTLSLRPGTGERWCSPPFSPPGSAFHVTTFCHQCWSCTKSSSPSSAHRHFSTWSCSSGCAGRVDLLLPRSSSPPCSWCAR